MNTIFCPNHDDINESINKEIRFLNELGIKTYDFKDFKKCPWKLASLYAVNLNWYDDINNSNKIKSIFTLVKKMVMITFLKIFKVKIIYTFHNKVAHDGKSKRENLILKKFIMKRADTISVLSTRSINYAKNIIGIEKKMPQFFFVGHPLYHNSLKTDVQRHEGLVFLYFGMVRPYKNLEMLIEVWKDLGLDGARLIIAGKPINNEYKNLLISLAKDINSIELILEYLPNEQLDLMISQSDIVVSPLDIKSSMNSGTLIKSMCMQKTIIIPTIEMVYDYDLDSMFAYSYDNEENHKDKLKSQFLRAYKIYLEDSDEICQMGRKLYQSVTNLNSDEVFKRRYSELYLGRDM